MKKDPFSQFIKLVEFDKGLIDIENEIKEAEEVKSSLNKKMSSFKEAMAEAKLKKVKAQKDVDTKELELKDLDQAIRERKEKLKAVSGQKEYNALKKELDSVQKDLISSETAIVSLWNKLETSKKEFAEKESEIQTQIVELEKTIEENCKEIEELNKKFDDLQKQRSSKIDGVPAEWQEKYHIMHGQVKNPVADVVSESCSACFYHVTSQDMIDLKKKRLMQCKGCYRFLYLKEVFSNQNEL